MATPSRAGRALRLTAFSERDLARCTFYQTEWQVWAVHGSNYWMM